MKIIVACVSLVLVACTRGQATSTINHQRLSGIGGSGRRVRSGTGGGGNCLAGVFLPAKSGGSAGSSNIQGWGARANSAKNIGGGGTSTINLPGPITLPAGSSDTSSTGAPVSSGGSGGNNFQAWGTGANSVSSQDSHGSASNYNFQVSRGNNDNSFQGWGAGAGGKSNQGSSGGSNFQGWVPIVGSASNQAGNGATGESNFQGRNSHAPSLPGPIGAASSHSSTSYSYSSPSSNGFTGGASNKGRNGGTGGGHGSGNYQGWGSTAVYNQGGNIGGRNSLPGPIGNAGGASFQSYSKVSVSSSKKGGRGIGSRSIHGNGLHAVPVGFQTTEGRKVDPNLLQQIRSILLQEEASSGFGGGAAGFSSPAHGFDTPSSAYGAPSSGSGGSGRVIGITVEGIDQSIQIAQFHQTTLDSSSFGTSSVTLAIPSGSYGAPY